MPLSFAVLTATKTSLGKRGSFPDAKRSGDGLSPPLLSPDNEPFRLALGNNRGGGLALTNKASAQTQASHDQNQRKCNLLHGPSPVCGHKGEHLLLRTTSAGKTQWMDSTYPKLMSASRHNCVLAGRSARDLPRRHRRPDRCSDLTRLAEPGTVAGGRHGACG